MKKRFLGLLILMTILVVSCKERKLTTLQIKDTDLTITVYEDEAEHNKNCFKIFEDSHELQLGKKGKRVRVIYREIEKQYYPENVELLAQAVTMHDDIKKYTLKNGAFGVSYQAKPNKKGKVKKGYIFYFKKDNKYYKIYNNETFNYKMKYFEHIKNVMESIQ
ncbi:hypothetical protein [Tenacibaculum sp. 190524A02b]|uniref:Lipoprotein n=1 Tax=Tenacibaculum vairaonense TaxID=3137860 RepID=A0ABP1FCP7_9FLAO